MSGSKAQKGFTLIEVSLAIVIGVIVLAGAITLYNQSKISAGNSKAQEKALAMASLVEELSANQSGAIPSPTAFGQAWMSRRDDAGSSPYGGAAGSASQLLGWTAITAVPAATPSDSGNGLFAPGAAAAINYYDNNAAATKSVRNYFVGIVDNTGRPAFIMGGR